MTRPHLDATAIRKGLADNEFFLEYQPIVSLADGRCQGAEALIRWRRDGKIVPPLDFIPLTDGTPLAGLITYWVADKLAEEIAGWLGAHPDAYISMNVPPEILGRGGLEHAAQKSGLIKRISQIVLEITERGVPDTMAVNSMGASTNPGLRLSIDDLTFAGGPNLAILSRCPFAFLKLDRTLIEQIVPGAPTPAWLTSMRAFLAAAPLAAVAEGVETKLQADTLRDANIRSAQGYYFSKPLSARDFIEYYRRTRAGPAKTT